MKPEHVQHLILKELGITYVLNVSPDGQGGYKREHHVYCPEGLYQELIRFSVRHTDEELIRVRVNPPPPF